MQVSQQQFAQNVMHIVYQICKMVYNVHSEDDIQRIFGASKEEIENIVARTVNALPNNVFDQATKGKIKELEEIMAKEFIFFQIQEKISDPQYQNDLANFILLLARDIKKRIGDEGKQ